MKQHISLSDLNQLSDKGKDAYWQYSKLNNWRKPDSDYDLWSIGQLIQFLWEHKYEPEDWEMLTFDDSTPMLCDDLWMAVKDILEKEICLQL